MPELPEMQALGAFLATMLSGKAKHGRRQGRAIMLPVLVWGAAIVVFGLSPWLWLSLLMLTIAGVGDMVSGIFRSGRALCILGVGLLRLFSPGFDRYDARHPTP